MTNSSPVEPVTHVVKREENIDEIRDIEVVVFDVLGTLVDQIGGRRAAIREALPSSGDATVGDLLTVWQHHVDDAQRRIGNGDHAYADSEAIDAEAARRVAQRAGLTDPAVIARLATADRRVPPWPDSVAGLERLARHRPVIALSNASRAALLRLNAHAGLRWHYALSAETVRAYKPSPDVYRLAIDAAGCPPDRILMVAAHAWDLRGAQTCGMRAAYVDRPSGAPPTGTDTFDGRFTTLNDLIAALSPE